MKSIKNKKLLTALATATLSALALGGLSACSKQQGKTIEKFVCEQTQISVAYQTVCELPSYYVTYSDGSVEKAGIRLTDEGGVSVPVSDSCFFVEQAVGTSYQAVYFAGTGDSAVEYSVEVLVVDDSAAPVLALTSDTVCVAVGDYVNLQTYYTVSDDSGIAPRMEYTLSYNGETKRGDGSGFIAEEGLYVVDLKVTDPSGHSSEMKRLSVVARYGNVIADFETEADIRSQEYPKGVRVQGAAFPTRSSEVVHGGAYSLFVNNNLNASVAKVIPFNASGDTNGDSVAEGDLIGMWCYFMPKDESGKIHLEFKLAPNYILNTKGGMEIYVDGAYYTGADVVGENSSTSLTATLPTETWVYVQYNVVEVGGNFFVGCTPVGYADNTIQFYVDDIAFGMKSDLRVFDYTFDLGANDTIEVDCAQAVNAYIFSRSVKNKRENANYQVFKETNGKLESVEANGNEKYTLSQGSYRAYLSNRDGEYGGIYARINVTKDTFASVAFDLKGNASLPNGIVNVKYPTAAVSCEPSITVQKKVFIGYGGANVQEVALDTEGCFTPNRMGRYTIEYTFTKGEESSVRTFDVLILETGDELTDNYDELDKLTTAYVGESYSLPEIEGYGGTGTVVKALKVKAPDGETQTLTDREVVFRAAGQYTLVYEVGDWLTTHTYEYTTVVSASALPIVEEEAVMPRYFSEGYEYAIDTVTGKLYANDGSYTEQTLKAYLRYKATDTLLENGLVTPFVDVSGDVVEIVYKAAVSGGEQDVRIYPVPVKKICATVDNTPTVNARELFDVENADVEISADGAQFTVLQNENRISVVSPLLLQNLQLNFSVPPSDLNEIELTFTDSRDKNDTIVVAIVADSDGKVYAEYNGVRNLMDGSFADGNILLSYNALYKAFYDGKNSQVVALSESVKFDSKKVYLDMRLYGATNGAEKKLIVRKLNGQDINADTVEYTAPELYVADFNIVSEKGTTFTLPRIVVSDLYDANPVVWLKVQKNGKAVSSTDNIPLNYVAADTYSFVLAETGSYSITYLVEDCFGNVKTYQKTVWSFDDNAFALNVSGEKEIKVSQNSVVNVPSCEVVGGNDVTMYVYLCNTQGQYEKLTDTSFRATEKGTYKIVYYATDKNNVVQIEYVKIIVE